MADEELGSKTIRIEIPPGLQTGLGGTKVAFDVSKIKGRPIKVKLPKAANKDFAESKYQQLLQSVYDAVLITDLNGRVVDANSRASEFFLFDRSELCETNILDLLSGADEPLLRALALQIQKERYALVQAYCVRKDATFFPAEIAVNVLRFEETRLCFFIRDIALRMQENSALGDAEGKAAEEATRREFEKQRAMLATIAATCHHLGQPVTVILTNLNLMAKRLLPNDHEFKRLLFEARDASEKVGKILYQLNTVNECRTQPYLEPKATGKDTVSEMLDLNQDKA